MDDLFTLGYVCIIAGIVGALLRAACVRGPPAKQGSRVVRGKMSCGLRHGAEVNHE